MRRNYLSRKRLTNFQEPMIGHQHWTTGIRQAHNYLGKTDILASKPAIWTLMIMMRTCETLPGAILVNKTQGRQCRRLAMLFLPCRRGHTKNLLTSTRPNRLLDMIILIARQGFKVTEPLLSQRSVEVLNLCTRRGILSPLQLHCKVLRRHTSIQPPVGQ